MRLGLAFLLASVLALGGCENVYTVGDRTEGTLADPPGDGVLERGTEGGAFLSRGALADQEYMASECPNGFYLVGEEPAYVERSEGDIASAAAFTALAADVSAEAVERHDHARPSLVVEEVPTTRRVNEIHYECAKPYSP